MKNRKVLKLLCTVILTIFGMFLGLGEVIGVLASEHRATERRIIDTSKDILTNSVIVTLTEEER